MLNKASMGRRIGAYFLDALFMWIIILIAFIVSFGLGFLVSALVAVLYFGISEGSKLHGSPGKNLCGLMVVDLQGNPLTYRKSFVRSLCKLLSSALFGVGYLIGFFDKDGKTLHDKIAGTMVVASVSVQSRQNYVQHNPMMSGQYPQLEAPQTNMVNSYANPMETMQGQARVVGISGLFAGRSFSVPLQGIMMGRDQTACDFVFPEGHSGQGISRVHCKIQYNPQTQMFILYDLGSSYGTFLANGTRVQQGQPAALCPGEEFYLATRAIRFRVNV